MKRSSPVDSNGSDSRGGRESPPAKRQRSVIFEPVRLPSISTVAELDYKVLAAQHSKLSLRLVHSKRIEDELRRRIEQLEKRQTQDDAVLCIINRHWNRLDEDVRILLERFDAEIAVEAETKHECEATSSFIAQLSQWDKEELNERLLQRVEFSKRAISKLVTGFDRLLQRNDKIVSLMQLCTKPTTLKDDQIVVKRECDDRSSTSVKSENDTETETDVKPRLDNDQDISITLNSGLAEMVTQLISENRRLQEVASKLQEKNHATGVKYSSTEDRFNASEAEIEELKIKLEESEYGLENSLAREDKLEFRLTEVAKQLQKLELQFATNQSSITVNAITSASSRSDGELTNVSKNKLEELQAQLDEQRELASNRLIEMQDLSDQRKEALKTIETLKMELAHLPEEVIANSSEYRRLQSHFSVLYAENITMRTQLEETRSHLEVAKETHTKQIEQMEGEELMAQKQLRAEMVNLEDQLSIVRREYEMLRIEFEQNLAANEQSGPLNKEMRQLLASYNTQNQQLKAEVARFKRKWREAVSLVAKTQKELDQERKAKDNCVVISLVNSDDSNDETDVPAEDSSSNDASEGGERLEINCSQDEEGEKPKSSGRLRSLTKQIAELEAELESYKNLSLDDSNRAQTEKRLRLENQKMRSRISVLVTKTGKDAATAEEPAKQIKKLEEQIERLKKDVQACKQEEEALLNEMENTGQAFEEMQEQNVRLVQQLKEKDDANFRLMSERIRWNQQEKLLKEERELLGEQVVALHDQVGAQNLVVCKLEEKERLMLHQLTAFEKEISSRQQALDLHKRKAMEQAQSAADLKLQLEKQTSQLTEAQSAVATKTTGLEDESFKRHRLQEEISGLRKRLERLKKMEQATTADEVLLEEIRELKSQLTCPSCKVQRKDAVLTKCFHVFCMECLKTRYETRQRKCPKCNAAFGANDFKRIYIG